MDRREPTLTRSGATSPSATRDGTLVPFKNGPYPFENGMVPAQDGPDVPFFTTDTDGRLFHLSPRGGKLFAKPTYDDNHSLIYIPRSFDIAKPNAVIVLFLHGNLATLEDVRGRQRVTRQLADSGLNAVLVAPQLAVKALDSSPGHFYERPFFQAYLHEAAEHLASMAQGRFDSSQIDALPVVIVAYSGGYLATAFSLHYAREDSRIKGVILLDALFGEELKFKEWIERTHETTFFISAYSEASSGMNIQLRDALRADRLRILDKVPPLIAPGDIVFQGAPSAGHNDFVTNAWVRDPLRQVLGRIRIAGKTK